MNHADKREKSGGFTLIELLLVVLIIGMIAAIAYPQYKVVSRANLRETSRKLAGTIRYLYAKAAMEKKQWRLAIDLDNNRIWPERLEPREDAPGEEFVPASIGSVKQVVLPRGVRVRDVRVVGRSPVERGMEYIHFSPYGGVERAVIHLEHDNHEWVFSLVTKPMSGRVAIFDHEADIEQFQMGERRWD